MNGRFCSRYETFSPPPPLRTALPSLHPVRCLQCLSPSRESHTHVRTRARTHAHTSMLMHLQKGRGECAQNVHIAVSVMWAPGPLCWWGCPIQWCAGRRQGCIGRFGGQESRASGTSRKGVEEVRKTGGSWPRQLVAAPTLCLSRGQGCFCKRQGFYFLHRRLAVGCQPWAANGQSTTLKAVDNRRQIRAFWSVWQQTALKRCARCTRGTWVGAHATHGDVYALVKY